MLGLTACGWAQRPGADQRQTKQQYYARVKAVYDRHQANPITALAPIFIQGPVFVGAFTGLRSLAMHKARPACRPGVAGFPAAAGPAGTSSSLCWLRKLLWRRAGSAAGVAASCGFTSA